MKIIDLSAAKWKTNLDFLTDLLKAIGAPVGHGCSIDALIDSMVWGGLNKQNPPYTIKIYQTKDLPTEILNQIKLLQSCLAKARSLFHHQKGHDVDVSIDIG